MTNPICPLCGSAENARCFSERGYDLRACNRCGLHFIHPYADLHSRNVLTYDFGSLKIEDPIVHYESSRSFYEGTYLDLIEGECKNAESILDIGCGTGYLLRTLREHYPTVRLAGIELNAKRAEFARREVNCDIFQVPVETFTYPGHFDVIMMINVLSHIASMDDLFASIRRIIAPHGKLILKVGEIQTGVRKDALFDWQIPDHLHFLGTATVDFVCSKYGFKLTRHDRKPISSELFSRRRWVVSGRSHMRNLLKRAVAATPFALPMLRRLYDARHRSSLYSSFMVMSPIPAPLTPTSHGS